MAKKSNKGSWKKYFDSIDDRAFIKDWTQKLTETQIQEVAKELKKVKIC